MTENYVLSDFYSLFHFLARGHAFSSQLQTPRFSFKPFMPRASVQLCCSSNPVSSFRAGLAKRGFILFTFGVSVQQPPATPLPVYLLAAAMRYVTSIL